MSGNWAQSVALSVNINKIATLRNSRGKNTPDVLRWAVEIEQMGASGITVHPRPDGRHIRSQDVRELMSVVRGEFNIEGFPNREWLDLVLEAKATQATLVPDPPEALTSNAGWDVLARADELSAAIRMLKAAGIRTSVFVDPAVFRTSQAQKLKEMGADRIELFTEDYADGFAHPAKRAAALEHLRSASRAASAAGLGVNAGHDLNLDNLPLLVASLPELKEVSIGHALIGDALRWGMAETLRRYLAAISR